MGTFAEYFCANTKKELKDEILALFETVGDRKLTVTEMTQLDPNLAQYPGVEVSAALRVMTDFDGTIVREYVGKKTYFGKA